MSNYYDQWIRKVGLTLYKGDKGLDLSEFRIRFNVVNGDYESPNSATIRVYNLSSETVNQVAMKGEFSEVVLQAGYESGNYGTIFSGTVKQYRIGRENATDTYLDIMAADGDLFYNQSTVSMPIPKGTAPYQVVSILEKATGIKVDISSLQTDKQFQPSLRGQVLMGMSRTQYRNIASHLDAGWSIQNGEIKMIDNTGYAEGEAVKINVGTGLVGIPEQTDEGIKLTCLLNSRLRIGSLIQLDNNEIVRMMQANQKTNEPLYTSNSHLFQIMPVNADGVYRTFVVEYVGDSRGNEWYSTITALAVKPSAPPNNSVSGT